MSKLNRVLSAMNTSKIRRIDIRVNQDDQYTQRVYFNGQMFHILEPSKIAKEVRRDRSEVFEAIELSDILYLEVEWKDNKVITLSGGELLSESFNRDSV